MFSDKTAKCKWQMTNDKWQMTNDKWQMTNDKWQMTNDKWQMPNDKCQIPNAKCQMPVAFCSFQNVGEIASWKFSLVLYQPTNNQKLHEMPSSGSIVVEHSPHHPKVQGLSPATVAGSGKESIMKN